MDGLLKLFIGRLPRHYGEGEIQNLVLPFGTCREVIVIRNHETGESKGCCFVKFATSEEAHACIAGLDGSLVDGHCLGCSMATDRRGPQQKTETKSHMNNAPIPQLQLQPVQLKMPMIRQVVVPQSQVLQPLQPSAFDDGESKLFVGGLPRENFRESDMKGILHEKEVIWGMERPMVVRHATQKNFNPRLQIGTPMLTVPSSPMMENIHDQGPRQIGNWIEYTDTDGSLYYHNAASNETQWDVPAEFQQMHGQGFVMCDSTQLVPHQQTPTPTSNIPVLKAPAQFCGIPQGNQSMMHIQSGYGPDVGHHSVAARYAPF